MNATYNFTPINLDDDDVLSTQWQYPPQAHCYNYNLLHGSLATNNDLKIESLDEALLTSSTTTPANSKKRKSDQNDISFVKLTREQLLVMSSIEFEDRVRLLQNMRPLTLAEEDEIKRQRKLIKNREYAQTSRIKKRETLSSLQVQFTTVNTENQILKSHITNLTQQVQYLQVENHQLRMMLSSYSLSPPPTLTTPNIATQHYPIFATQNPHVNLPSSPESSLSSDAYSPSDENDPFGVITSDSDEMSFAIDLASEKGLVENGDQYSSLYGKNYTTGLCVLVILFSFGLFFNGVLLEGITVMVAPSLPGGSTSTGRTLFNVNDKTQEVLKMYEETGSLEKYMEEDNATEVVEEDNATEVVEEDNATEVVEEKEVKLKELHKAGHTIDLVPYL